jgi:hypothetical protein
MLYILYCILYYVHFIGAIGGSIFGIIMIHKMKNKLKMTTFISKIIEYIKGAFGGMLIVCFVIDVIPILFLCNIVTSTKNIPTCLRNRMK